MELSGGSRDRILGELGAPIATVILFGMTYRVGPKGQVVIPKELRDELGIEPGDEVNFWRDGDHVALRPARRRPALRGRFEGSALTDDLTAQRHADRERELER
jgi:AbrB family looped-hinge helix DNA binding protein